MIMETIYVYNDDGELIRKATYADSNIISDERIDIFKTTGSSFTTIVSTNHVLGNVIKSCKDEFGNMISSIEIEGEDAVYKDLYDYEPKSRRESYLS